MSDLMGRPVRPAVPAHRAADDWHEQVLGDLGPKVFVSLARSDQRCKAMQYVRALLATPGRKSVRNIARSVGGAAAAQRLHHFVNSSPWDWRLVRRAVARHLVDVAAPQAWVIRQTVFPKAGTSSVGVGRSYDPVQGKVLNAQRALGVWFASAAMCSPVDWHLLLPRQHVPAAGRAPYAPDGGEAESLAETAVRVYAATTTGLPRQPVIMDARGVEAELLIHELWERELPFLVRVDHAHRFRPERDARPEPAHLLLAARNRMRRPVTAPPTLRPEATATVAATLQVRAAGGNRPARASGPLILLGLGPLGGPWPAGVWVTNLAETSASELYGSTLLTDSVDDAFTEACATSGLRDFAGRSFGGWHRHVTLASTAHTISTLTRLRQPPGPPSTRRR
ncbi:IS701 family transposase [Myceligenerans xiligouense]|uniref:DDE superfamily endonuclease n=1 Tax=Myceligenerans xiligouense TaxID=253184 RepID=A0A3N4YQR2_9MICO|nr:transposase [Myceligenerans xiligouense]RPF21694.1 DDE superfamily endonuclease [Myceligenerans xiligouense]